MAFIAIIGLTLIVILGLRYLPGRMQYIAGPRELTIAIALPLLGTFGMTYPVFVLGMMVLVLLAPAVSGAGVAVLPPNATEQRARIYLMCLPLMPLMVYTIVFGGLTYAQFNYAHLLSVAFLLSLFLSGERMSDARMQSWDILFALMMLIQAYMDCRGNSATYSIRACNQVLLNLALPYFLISRIFLRAKSPNDLMLSVILGGCILALIASFEAPRHWLLYDNMPKGLGTDPEVSSGYAKQRGGLLRARASFPESTGLSLFLGMQVVLVVAMRRQVKSTVTFLAMLALLASGVFFTLARIGYIVVVAGLLACMIHERRWLVLFQLLIAIPILGGMLLVMSKFIPTLAASMGTSQDAAGSVDYRSDLLSSGLGLVRENWATGMTMDNIYMRLEHLRQGEGIIDLVDQPLTILMRGGIFGAAMYYAVLVGVLGSLFARYRQFGKESAATSTACFAGLVGLMASLTTTSYGRNETTYVMLIAIGAGMLGRVTVKAAVPAARVGYQAAAMAK